MIKSITDNLFACPWCKSEKVMAEGTDKRMAMVCQKCLARGPEVNAHEGRNAAIHEWNKAIRQPPNPEKRFNCETCGLPVARVWYGTRKEFRWRHFGIRGKRLACKNVKINWPPVAEKL